MQCFLDVYAIYYSGQPEPVLLYLCKLGSMLVGLASFSMHSYLSRFHCKRLASSPGKQSRVPSFLVHNIKQQVHDMALNLLSSLKQLPLPAFLVHNIKQQVRGIPLNVLSSSSVVLLACPLLTRASSPSEYLRR